MMFWCTQLSGVAMSGTLSAPPDKRPERPVLPGGPRHLGDAPPSAGRKDRFLAVAFTAAVHAIVFAALFWPRAARPPAHIVPQPSLQVSLLETPKLTPPGPPEPVMLRPASVDVAPPHLAMRAPTHSAITVPDTSDLLSDSQLAGAATVGGAGGRGTCDMARAVQQALRRDPMVRASVEEAHRSGRAIMLWNGDWVQSGDQDGKGLSAVREAVTWEVAFAPEACRNTRMHGLVLLSLADGSTRFALGSGDWRWSDLLGLRH
jgi:hypothetical protein